MKLRYIKIKRENFKGIQAGSEFFFNVKETFKNKLSPKVLCGVNGSGKSNLLELISEIFAYCYENVIEYELSFDFEIEYFLTIEEKIHFVRIKKDTAILPIEDRQDNKKNNVKFSPETFTELSFYKADDPNQKIDQIEELIESKEINAMMIAQLNNFERYLPKRIFAYSSGDNELLSNTYLKYKANDLSTYATNGILAQMQFVNKESAYINFISSFILCSSKNIYNLKQLIKIEGLHSFRITLQNYLDREPFSLVVAKLKNCATCFYENPEKVLTMDFFIDEGTIQAFKSQFITAQELAESLYKLELLNTSQYLEFFHNLKTSSQFKESICDELPKTDPSKLIFRIENIRIKKLKNIQDYSNQLLPWELPLKEELKQLEDDFNGNINKDMNKKVIKPTIEMKYHSLSDGEHQIIEILCLLMLNYDNNILYILDEPETHLNPQWKYDYIKLFESILSNFNIEILMTTHDPILLLGLEKENVFIISRSEKNILTFENPDFDLIGVGIEGILTSEIFKMNTTLDSGTMLKYIERRQLLILKDENSISIDQNKRLSDLSLELSNIDFNIPFADPLYKDYILAIKNLDPYKKVTLSKAEENERKKISREVKEKLKQNGY